MASGTNGKNGSGRRNYRSMRRSQNHDDAQALEGKDRPVIPDHPLVCGDEPVLIDNAVTLEEFVEHIRSIGRFGYDTEFIGEESYYPQLCLIQLSTSDRLAIVDPLMDFDITAVWELIADESVETIVHSGLQDLEIAVRALGKQPANVFDTQIAAGFVGYPFPVGLGKLVREVMGVGLGKAHTFTRWDRRPLTEMQLLYAADDVRYLAALHAHLSEKLKTAGYEPWAKQEFALASEDVTGEVDLEALCRRVQGTSQLRAKSYAILRALVTFRDESAREQDLPPRSFLKDSILRDIARRPAKTLADLKQVRGLPRPVVEEYGQRILDLIVEAKPIKQPRSSKPLIDDDSPLDRVRIDSLWSMVCSYCMGRSIDPNLVTNRRQVGEFYRTVVSGKSLDHFPVMQGWRRELMGDLLGAFCRGDTSIELRWLEGELKANDAQQVVD